MNMESKIEALALSRQNLNEKLHESLDNVSSLFQSVESCKGDLENKKTQILLDNDPKDLGSNETARKAAVDNLCKTEKEALRATEISLKIAEASLKKLYEDKDNLNFQLQCCQLIQQTN